MSVPSKKSCKVVQRELCAATHASINKLTVETPKIATTHFIDYQWEIGLIVKCRQPLPDEDSAAIHRPYAPEQVHSFHTFFVIGRVAVEQVPSA